MSQIGPLLVVESLTVRIPGPEGVAEILSNVSITVGSGERVAIVGETGCGKSLTASAIMEQLPSQAQITGRIRFDGVEIDRRSRGKSPRPPPGAAMVFQQPMAALNPVFTIGDQMRAVARTLSGRRGMKRRQIDELCAQVLNEAQLNEPRRVMASHPFQLSGGMRQRVLIALALLKRPRLLIADEPGTALDVTIQAEILALLDTLVAKQGLALLHITHNLGVAREYTDRIYVMYAGTIAEHGKTHELFENPLHPYTIGLLNSVPRLDGGGPGLGIPGTLPSYFRAPKGCRFAPRCPISDAACDSRPADLKLLAHAASCHHLDHAKEVLEPWSRQL